MNELISEVNAEHDAELSAIDQATPSLSSSAVIADLSIGVWEGRKTDKRASDEVAVENNIAKKKMVSVNKALVDSEHLTAIKKLRGVVRNHVHYHLTLPWSDSGSRLLTTRALFDYQHQMTELQSEFWKLVNEFIDNYDYEVAKVQVELGDLFRQADYPSAEEVRSRFKFEVTYMPLPDAGDFRIDIGNTAREEMADSYNKFYAKKFNAAMSDVWERLMEPLSNMVERLDYVEGNDKKRFKNTLVDNVVDMLEVMRMANVGDDPHMTKVETNLRNALLGVTAEALRDNESLRRNTHKAAVDALKETKQAIDNLPSIW